MDDTKTEKQKYDAAWYKRNRDRLAEVRRQRYQDNPDAKREYQLAHKFGITLDEYRTRLEAQGGVCAICHNTCSSGRSLAVDHDHETGKVRGLLCGVCNRGLGNFADSVQNLRNAVAYLSREVI